MFTLIYFFKTASKFNRQFFLLKISFNSRRIRRERERLVTPPAPGDVYVELKEIPVGIGLQEIVSFFGKLQVTQVKLVGDGSAYVQLKDVDMKQEALTYDQRFLSSKFVKGI